MKKKICTLVILAILSLTISKVTKSQTIHDELIKLNAVCKNSLYQSNFSIDSTGLITRKTENSNASFSEIKFKLEDITDIKYDFDGFHNLIIKLKHNTLIITKEKKSKKGSLISVISFKNQDDCYKAVILFKNLMKYKD